MSHRAAVAFLAVLCVWSGLTTWALLQSPGLSQDFRIRLVYAWGLSNLLMITGGMVMAYGYDQGMAHLGRRWSEDRDQVMVEGEALKAKVSALERERQDTELRWQEMVSALEQARKDLESFTQDIIKEQDRAQRITSELESLRESRAEITQERETLKKELQTWKERQQEEAKEWQDRVSSAGEKMQRLNADLVSAASRADELERLGAQATIREADMKTALDQVSGDRSALKALTDERDALKQKLALMDVDAETVRKDAESLKKDLDGLKKVADGLKAEVDTAKKNAETTKKELEAVTKDAHAAKKALEDMKKAAVAPSTSVPTPPLAVSLPSLAIPVASMVPPPAQVAPIVAALVEPLPLERAPRTPVTAAPPLPPLVRVSSPSPVSPAMAPSGGKAEQEKDVLVIDKDGTVLNQFRNDLYKLGYSVHVARTGQDAVRKLGLTSYAFLVLNTDIADMTWQQLLEKLKGAAGPAGQKVLCCDPKRGAAAGDDFAKAGVPWFDPKSNSSQFQVLVKQVAGG